MNEGLEDELYEQKRVSADICPLCGGAVLAPESLLAHLRDEHAHHPCLYPGCAVAGHVEPVTFEEAQQYGREAEAADLRMELSTLREAQRSYRMDGATCDRLRNK